MLEASKIWENIKRELNEKEIILSKRTYENVYAVEFKDNILVLEIEDKESYNEIFSTKTDIEMLLNKLLGMFISTKDKKLEVELKKLYVDDVFDIYTDYVKNEKFKSNLNEDFTFDNYVVSDNNIHAYALAENMATGSVEYSPLVIFGHPGYGKTHLASAIANEIIKNDPQKKILYITSMQFSDELVLSFQNKTTISFKEKFKNLDGLIVDDIQFFETVFGKGDDKIQKEFYEAFNTLLMKNKPVILISDRFPNLIKNVEERLISRFIAGAPIEIKKPDRNMIVSIIKFITEKNNVNISNELCYYIADKLDVNIREVKGFLKIISFKAGFSKANGDEKATITKELIDQELENRIIEKKNEITSEKVIEKSLQYYNQTREEVLGKSRKSEVVRVRDVIRYILVTELKMGMKEVGKIFDSDHSAVTKSVQKISEIKSKNDDESIIKDIETIIINLED